MNPQASARVISDREFVLEHTFKAPAAKVFAAYTDPKLVPLWWAAKWGSLQVDAMDVRPGGKYRYVQRAPNGQEATFFGTYLEVEPTTRLVYTYAVEGRPGEVRATVELTERDGVTRLVLTNLCASKEVRDAMLQHGAAVGAKAAWDQLATVVGGSA